MYKCKNFRIEELVPEELYKLRHSLLHEEIFWRMFDEKLLRGLDWLKEIFPKGTITVNNWCWSGKFNQSGLRTKDSRYYSEGSRHSLGMAADLKFSAYSVEEVAKRLEEVVYSPYIRRVENIVFTPSWVHVDVATTNRNDIYFFNP